MQTSPLRCGRCGASTNLYLRWFGIATVCQACRGTLTANAAAAGWDGARLRQHLLTLRPSTTEPSHTFGFAEEPAISDADVSEATQV
jgi:hypothetical protein